VRLEPKDLDFLALLAEAAQRNRRTVRLAPETLKALVDAAREVSEDDLVQRIALLLRMRPWIHKDTIMGELGVGRTRLLKALDEGVEVGRLERGGEGTKASPYCFAIFGTPRPS